jgi:hypothetical protein
MDETVVAAAVMESKTFTFHTNFSGITMDLLLLSYYNNLKFTPF